MEKRSTRRSKAKAHASSQQTLLPLQLATSTGGSSSNEDGNVKPAVRSTRVDRSWKSDSKKGRKAGRSVHTSLNESLSVDEIVPIGAVHVTTTRSENGREDESEEGAITEVESPGRMWSYEQTVEAHMVEDSSAAAFLEQEKEKYEQETRERILAELTGHAAQAVVVIQEEKKQHERSYLWSGCLCAVLVLIIVTTVGVVLSSKTSANSSDPAREASSQGSVVGSPIPSLLTDEPSGQPSLMPTLEPQNNTFCDEAHELVVGQIISGSLEDSIGSLVNFCESNSVFGSYVLYSTPGRWYVYHGEGFPVFAKTDPFVDIHLYLDCDSSCHNEAIYTNWENESTVLWEAETGTDYYILISAPEGMDQDNNQAFTLTFQTNDSLETAYGPLTPGHDSMVGGSTVGTKVASDVPACGSASAPTAPGVWYAVMGNGRIITASTCGSPTGLDTQISVFTEGTNSSCIAGNDDFCSSKSQVAWSSTEDEIYYILVHGKDGAEGTFILQVSTEGASLADADFCANAKSVEVGFSRPVDLSQATADPDVSNWTGSSLRTVVGNFYTFIGSGEDVSIFLDYPTILDSMASPPRPVVLTGSCSALECVAACDDYFDNFSCRVSAVLGQKYYVNVFYIEESFVEGDFELNGGVNLTIQAGG